MLPVDKFPEIQRPLPQQPPTPALLFSVVFKVPFWNDIFSDLTPISAGLWGTMGFPSDEI